MADAKESMLARVGAVISRAEQQRCRVLRIRLPLWAYFELMCDFQAAEIPYPVNGVALVRDVPVLRSNATELAIEQLRRQQQPIGTAPVLH